MTLAEYLAQDLRSNEEVEIDGESWSMHLIDNTPRWWLTKNDFSNTAYELRRVES